MKMNITRKKEITIIAIIMIAKKEKIRTTIMKKVMKRIKIMNMNTLTVKDTIRTMIRDMIRTMTKSTTKIMKKIMIKTMTKIMIRDMTRIMNMNIPTVKVEKTIRDMIRIMVRTMTKIMIRDMIKTMTTNILTIKEEKLMKRDMTRIMIITMNMNILAVKEGKIMIRDMIRTMKKDTRNITNMNIAMEESKEDLIKRKKMQITTTTNTIMEKTTIFKMDITTILIKKASTLIQVLELEKVIKATTTIKKDINKKSEKCLFYFK